MFCENKPIDAPSETPDERIAKALAIAVYACGVDGAHHKDWVIDQMTRALTGCPVVMVVKPTYRYNTQGESEQYRALVAKATTREDGSNSGAWEIGSAP